jgi:hypothetical protein
MKMPKMLKPQNLNTFGAFAKMSQGAHVPSEDAHPGHLLLTIYYYERKRERPGRRCSRRMGLTRAKDIDDGGAPGSRLQFAAGTSARAGQRIPFENAPGYRHAPSACRSVQKPEFRFLNRPVIGIPITTLVVGSGTP